MKNKAVTLPSINSSPAINTFVSTWDSYYLHTQTLHVPGREGSHRLWLHWDLFVYNSIKVWEGCSWCCLNNEKAPKPCLETCLSGSCAHHWSLCTPWQDEWTGWVKADYWAMEAQKWSPLRQAAHRWKRYGIKSTAALLLRCQRYE